MTDEDKQLIALLQGDTGTPKVDMGPGARAQRDTSSMRPAVKPDTVADEDLRSDYTKRDPRRTLQGRQDLITTPDAKAARDARAQAEDPIKNDPIAGAIVQSIPAAGLGMLAGAASRALAPASPLLSRAVQSATTGAASNPDHPVVGAATGLATQAIPLARGATNAAGEAALDRVTSPSFGQGPGKLAKAVGAGVGATVGGKIAGGAGAVAGGAAGSAVPVAISRGLDKLSQRLAERHMARMAALRTAAGDAAAVPTPVGEEVTVPEKYVPIQKAADAKVAELEANAPFKQTPAAHAPVTNPMSLEDKLQASVEIMGDLRVAQATGTMTPQLVQKALDAGISPTAVYHLVGNKAAANVALKKAIVGE